MTDQPAPGPALLSEAEARNLDANLRVQARVVTEVQEENERLHRENDRLAALLADTSMDLGESQAALDATRQELAVARADQEAEAIRVRACFERQSTTFKRLVAEKIALRRDRDTARAEAQRLRAAIAESLKRANACGDGSNRRVAATQEFVAKNVTWPIREALAATTSTPAAPVAQAAADAGAEVVQLREALAFYADRAQWSGFFFPIHQDAGNRARVVLAMTGDERAIAGAAVDAMTGGRLGSPADQPAGGEHGSES